LQTCWTMFIWWSQIIAARSSGAPIRQPVWARATSS
jgi:hypothetical protein